MRSILDELKRSIVNKGFVLAILLVFIMYFIDGNESLDEYANLVSLLDLITNVGAFTWVIPCIGTLCYAGSFVSEYSQGYVRYKYMRIGVRRYALQKCTVTFISACVAVFAGVFLYAVYAYSVCGQIMDPDVLNNYSPYADSVSFYVLIIRGQYIEYLMLLTFIRGLAAGTCSLLGLFLSTVWKNSYIALFSPAILIYFKDYVLNWLSVYPNLSLKSMEFGQINIGGVIKPAAVIVVVFMAISALTTLFVYCSLKRGCADV